MSRTSVETQLAKIRKAKLALEKKEKTLLDRTQDRTITKIVELVTVNNISIEQIAEALKKSGGKTGRAKKSVDKRAQVPPKYRNPANASETWTGRGKAPLWIKTMSAAGTLETALIS